MPLGIAWAGLKWRAFVRGAGAGKKCAATGKCRGLGRHSVGPVEPGPTPGSSVTSRGTAVSDNHELYARRRPHDRAGDMVAIM
jgi:hypothetical protein